MIHFTRQSQALVPDEHGYLAWVCRQERASVDPRRLAVVVCDMWDRTWSRAANERCEPLARAIDRFLTVVRKADVAIIHAPSGTPGPYDGTPARLRAQAVPRHPLPEKRAHEDPVLPIDDSDGGSDTNLGDEKVHTTVQTRQTALIAIDQARDFISDSGPEIYSVMQARGIETVLLCGVHTNMCVMNRTFGIKSFVSRGIPIMLVRDLTDSLYNPGRSPYVTHDEGTALMVGYVEKFWCPTVTSAEIIASVSV